MTDNIKECTTFWMSFCDDNRPTGQKFLGVVLVDAESLEEAVTAAWKAGCNPGGEIASIEVTPDIKANGPAEDVARFARMPRLVLLSESELRSFGCDIATTGELIDEGYDLSSVEIVHDEHGDDA